MGTMGKPFHLPLEARYFCYRSTDCDLLVHPVTKEREQEPQTILHAVWDSKHTLWLASAQRVGTPLPKGGDTHPALETGSGHPQIRTLVVDSMLCDLPMAGRYHGVHFPDSFPILRERDNQFHHIQSFMLRIHTATSCAGSCRLSTQPRLSRPLPCAPLK